MGVSFIRNFAEGISIDHCSGGAVDHSWGWVAGAGDLTLVLGLVSAERERDPRSFSHGLVVARLVFVSGDDDNLKVLCITSVPCVVEVFQGGLEWCASTSPGGRVDYHDEFVPINYFAAASGTISLHK